MYTKINNNLTNDLFEWRFIRKKVKFYFRNSEKPSPVLYQYAYKIYYYRTPTQLCSKNFYRSVWRRFRFQNKVMLWSILAAHVCGWSAVGSGPQLNGFLQLNEKWPYSESVGGNTKKWGHRSYTFLESNLSRVKLVRFQYMVVRFVCM